MRAKRQIGSIPPVNVPTISSFTLEQWMAEYDRLRKLNGENMGSKDGKSALGRNVRCR